MTSELKTGSVVHITMSTSTQSITSLKLAGPHTTHHPIRGFVRRVVDRTAHIKIRSRKAVFEVLVPPDQPLPMVFSTVLCAPITQGGILGISALLGPVKALDRPLPTCRDVLAPDSAAALQQALGVDTDLSSIELLSPLMAPVGFIALKPSNKIDFMQVEEDILTRASCCDDGKLGLLSSLQDKLDQGCHALIYTDEANAGPLTAVLGQWFAQSDFLGAHRKLTVLYRTPPGVTRHNLLNVVPTKLLSREVFKSTLQRVSYPQKRRVPDQKRRVPGQKQPKTTKTPHFKQSSKFDTGHKRIKRSLQPGHFFNACVVQDRHQKHAVFAALRGERPGWHLPGCKAAYSLSLSVSRVSSFS